MIMRKKTGYKDQIVWILDIGILINEMKLWLLSTVWIFQFRSLLGIAEMKGKFFDATCTNRENVVKFYRKFQDVSDVTFAGLYEQETVHVIVCWVPIPMPNNRIKQKFVNDFGKEVKVFNKKCSDGLVSGVRVVIMERKQIEVHPIPSY